MSVRLFSSVIHNAADAAVSRFANGPKTSSIVVRAALPAIAGSHAAFYAFNQVKQQTRKPEPKTEIVWSHPKGEDLTAEVRTLREKTKGTAGAILFHGTPHSLSMIEQAESCPEGLGKLEKRVCSNGDAAAGIYGTSSPVGTYEYSGAEFMAKIISSGRVHFDEARGTPYLEAGDDKHLVEVHRVTNHEEIKAHKEPTLVDSLRVAVEAGFKAFNDVRARLA
jgi:hypothetical protein